MFAESSPPPSARRRRVAFSCASIDHEAVPRSHAHGRSVASSSPSPSRREVGEGSRTRTRTRMLPLSWLSVALLVLGGAVVVEVEGARPRRGRRQQQQQQQQQHYPQRQNEYYQRPPQQQQQQQQNYEYQEWQQPQQHQPQQHRQPPPPRQPQRQQWQQQNEHSQQPQRRQQPQYQQEQLQQQQQQRQQNQRPRSRFAASSNSDDDEDEPPKNYFERNGLTPPPLVSRRRRHPHERRQQQQQQGQQQQPQQRQQRKHQQRDRRALNLDEALAAANLGSAGSFEEAKAEEMIEAAEAVAGLDGEAAAVEATLENLWDNGFAGDEHQDLPHSEEGGELPDDIIDEEEEYVEDEVDEPSELDLLVEGFKQGGDPNARLRHDLVYTHDGEFDYYYYDRHSYPWEYVWHNQTHKDFSPGLAGAAEKLAAQIGLTGVPVEMNVNFHRVFSVDIVNSVMDLVVWLRLTWVDPRLTWIPEEYDGLTETRFWIGDGGSGGETSEIWTPDVELWNLETGLRDTLEDAYARVTYDGVVTWRRPGHVKPTCKFRGLEKFPFDDLTCTLEFGSWMYSSRYLSLEMYEGKGYSMGGSVTAGERYEEYSFADVDPVSCERYVYPPEHRAEAYSREDEWNVLLYNVTVTRSWQPYARGYIATQVLLNFVGFSAFWLPPSCGERMSLSITAMLAALAAEIVVSGYLPACAEMTWFSKFSVLSMAFAFVSLLESVMVLYFYYSRSEDIVPEWYSFAKNWYFVRQARRAKEEVQKFGDTVADNTKEWVDKTNELVAEKTSELKTRTTEFVKDSSDEIVEAFQNSGEVIAEGFRTTALAAQQRSSRSNGQRADEDRLRLRQIYEEDDEFEDEGSVSGSRRDSVSGSISGSLQSSGPFRRTVTFEGEPYITDEGGNLRRRSNLMRNFKEKYGHSVGTGVGNSVHSQGTGGANLPKNADDFQTDQEVENNLKWKRVASRIDDVARFWILASYAISLSIILGELI